MHNVSYSEQNHSKEKEKQEGKVVIWAGFINTWRKKRSKKQGRKAKVHPTKRTFPKNSTDKKAFFNEQCIKLEDNNRRGKTSDLFRKIGDIEETREYFTQRWAQ